MWILYAEDNDELRNYFLEVFKRSKLEVRAFENGQEAFDYLLANKNDLPSVIVTDYQMPVLNGVCFIKAVRENRFLCDLPIIMMSGHPYVEDIGTKAGANVTIEKDSERTDILLKEIKRLSS